MSKKIIILGELNKKLILPFCLAFTHILMNIHYKYYPENTHSLISDMLPFSFGFIGIRFIPFVLRFSPDNKDEINFLKKKYFYIIFY